MRHARQELFPRESNPSRSLRDVLPSAEKQKLTHILQVRKDFLIKSYTNSRMPQPPFTDDIPLNSCLPTTAEGELPGRGGEAVKTLKKLGYGCVA